MLKILEEFEFYESKLTISHIVLYIAASLCSINFKLMYIIAYSS